MRLIPAQNDRGVTDHAWLTEERYESMRRNVYVSVASSVAEIR